MKTPQLQVASKRGWGVLPKFGFRIWGSTVLLFYVAASLSLSAQPPPTDPLMQLMLTQPKIDISSNVTATASFDPPAVRPGEESTYRVVFNALEESIAWPSEPPASPGLEMSAGAHGQLLQMGGVSMQPRTTFNYHVRPNSVGDFTMPEFKVKVYDQTVTVPVAHLEVTQQPPPLPAPQRLILEILATNLYVGQSVNVRIVLPSGPGGALQVLGQAQVTGEGFIVDQNPMRQRIESIPRSPGGERVTTLVCETALTPITAGKLLAFAQGYTAGLNSGGPIIIHGPIVLPGGPPRYTLLDSEPVEFQVKPLPRHGEMPGFTGAIGRYSLDPPALATNIVRVGDAVRLTVKARGEGNLARLVAPQPPRARDWQIFSNPPDNTPAQIIQAQGFTTFSYTLIPLIEEVKETPAIPFSFFDPVRGAYVDLSVPPVPVAVKPSAAVADFKAFSQADSSGSGPAEKEPVLSDLSVSPGRASGSLVPAQQRPWFPLMHLVPAAAFVGLWGWDRRRRFLEQHPQLVLRRRAQRALHRQWRALRRAARASDAPGFASAGVSAMRVASAPHYPAEPRALVGSDVLALLDRSARSGRTGEIVRRFFAVSDATRFATSPSDTSQLFALQSELEGVLRQLEAKL